MTRREQTLMAACAGLLAYAGLAAWTPEWFWRPRLGNARTAREVSDIAFVGAFHGLFDVYPPSGEWDALTVTAWMRMTTTNESMTIGQYQRTTGAFWCPEAVELERPDLFGGALGHGGDGVLITGAVVAAAALAPNGVAATSNRWPNGVATIDGWCDQPMTISVGGTEILLPAGTTNLNVVAGPGYDVVCSGSGTVALGVSQAKIHQFFSEVDGVSESEINQRLSATSKITNEYAFCVWRFGLTAEAHVYRGDLWQYDLSYQMGQTRTNAMPDAGGRSLSSAGRYMVGVLGLGVISESMRLDVFDLRVFPYWLTDEDLMVIHGDGVAEIERRGIPRWRGR